MTTEAVLASGLHRDELTAYCRRMLGSSFDAEDAVQETFLRAWRASARFEGRAPLRAWLYRIARNVCLDALGHARGSRYRSRSLPQPMDAAGDPDPSDPCDEALARERLRLAIVVAIGNLPPKQRAVLLLRDVLSWHASEVAELLATTTGGREQRPPAGARCTRGGRPGGRVGHHGAIGRELVARYLTAFADDDVDALVSLSRAA